MSPALYEVGLWVETSHVSSSLPAKAVDYRFEPRNRLPEHRNPGSHVGPISRTV